MDPMLTPREAAGRLRVSLRTLETWRRREQGPSYVKVEGQIRYPEPDLAQYLAARRIERQK